MSRQVDLTKPLSVRDRDYLLNRDQHWAVAFNAEVTGTDLPEKVVESIRARGITADEIRRAVSAARGEDEIDDATETATSEVSAGSDDASPEDDGPAKFTEEWFDSATIAMLQPELESRGLPKTGKRDDLADRLYEHMDANGELPGDE